MIERDLVEKLMRLSKAQRDLIEQSIAQALFETEGNQSPAESSPENSLEVS
jgi:hypothetical protein